MANIRREAVPIAITPDTADRLIERGSGDAALLYLFLLRTNGEYHSQTVQEALHWNAAQAMSAYRHLVELGLVEDNEPESRKSAPRPENCPEYSTEEITAVINDEGSGFHALLLEVEHLLGKTLNRMELKVLLEMYDYLAIPEEVLLLLVVHQIEETEAKLGVGRRPRLSEIKAAAYGWKKAGIETLESAEAWLKKQQYYRSGEGEMLRAVGVTGREAVNHEREYLHRWIEWGFTPDAVRLAYERTVMKKGSMDWPYCNGILRKWNTKNVHTVPEIEASEKPGRRSPAGKAQSAAPQGTGTDKGRAKKNADWMRQMLEGDE